MIFDDFENDEECFQQFPRKQNSLSSPNDSLENMIVDRQNKIRAREFSSFYRIYEVQVNPFTKDVDLAPKTKQNQNNLEITSAVDSEFNKSMHEFHLNAEADNQRQFLETHQREEIDSNSSDDSHSHSMTCQSANHQSEQPNQSVHNSKLLSKSLEKIKNVISQNVVKKSSIFMPKRVYLSGSNSNILIPKNKTTNVNKTKSVCEYSEDHFFNNDGFGKMRFDSFGSIKCNNKERELEDKDCHLCHIDFRYKQIVAEIANCLHKFHKHCIDDYLANSDVNALLQCPVCQCDL